MCSAKRLSNAFSRFFQATTLVAEKVLEPRATSGGWNEGVPANLAVSSSSEYRSRSSATWTQNKNPPLPAGQVISIQKHTPKSMILSTPSSVNCRFEGFMSRWTTPREWQCCTGQTGWEPFYKNAFNSTQATHPNINVPWVQLLADKKDSANF